MRKIKFETNEIYHIYNRGVERRKIFLDDRDYNRFICSLYEFNNDMPVGKFKDLMISIFVKNLEHDKKPIVEILVFCLMPNHFHLLIRQIENDGIVKFMHKLSTSYSKYFNTKNTRVGPLFPASTRRSSLGGQGRFKAVLIKQENHFLYLPYYIHLNPLDLLMPDWKEKGIKDYKKAEQFLNSYYSSSHLDYIGKKNFPLVISKDFLIEMWGKPQNYTLGVKQWLKNSCIEEINQEIIE